jgi:hypothetical protein
MYKATVYARDSGVMEITHKRPFVTKIQDNKFVFVHPEGIGETTEYILIPADALLMVQVEKVDEPQG